MFVICVKVDENAQCAKDKAHVITVVVWDVGCAKTRANVSGVMVQVSVLIAIARVYVQTVMV